jgi:type I restriction enzyme R subunit
MTTFTESTVEEDALARLESLGWPVKHGPDISPDGETLTLSLSQRERERYGEVVLAQRLCDALVSRRA